MFHQSLTRIRGRPPPSQLSQGLAHSCSHPGCATMFSQVHQKVTNEKARPTGSCAKPDTVPEESCYQESQRLPRGAESTQSLRETGVQAGPTGPPRVRLATTL